MWLRLVYPMFPFQNALLSAQVTDSGHLIDQLKQRNENLQDRLEMFEQLNNTLEEEKKTLLMQVNKLLEQVRGLGHHTHNNTHKAQKLTCSVLLYRTKAC